MKKNKEDAPLKKLLDVFKQLHINLLFVKALSEMPKSAKLMKELLTNKRKLEEASMVALSEHYSSIL